MDLYYVTALNDTFKLFMMDLDNMKLNNNPLMVYKFSAVGDKPMMGIYVRSSSYKETGESLNLKRLIFLQHGPTLYYANPFLGSLTPIAIVEKVKSIDDYNTIYFKGDITSNN